MPPAAFGRCRRRRSGFALLRGNFFGARRLGRLERIVGAAHLRIVVEDVAARSGDAANGGS